MGRIIGIDLGTTNSAVAVLEGGEPTLIPSSDGGYLTPSVVAIDQKTGERLVGEPAKNKGAIDPKNTIYSVKRFMGRKYDELDKDPMLKKAAEQAPYELTRAENGDIRIMINDRAYSPPEISAMVLQKLKADAERFLGETIDQAVITVPAYFNDVQRNATKDAGRIAGLDVLRIINEPTAASLAYGIDRNRDGLIAVYDLGGGTFDISILNLEDGVFDVQATNGDTFLGGDDFDAEIVDWLTMQFEKANDIDLLRDTKTRLRLKDEAEKAKIALSSSDQVTIDMPFLANVAGEPIHFGTSMTQSQLSSLVDDLVRKTLNPCKVALKDAGSAASDMDAILLAGGMTHMPAIRGSVAGFFGKEPMTNVNPDRVVAMGAAIQAGIMGGDVTGIALLDVTPLTLSVETVGDVASQMVARNTTIPTKVTESFSTVADNQTSVAINVVQGERKMASDNTSLGQFSLDGIPPKPRGEASFNITFEIDANGILQVSAKDKATGREKHITISAASGLSSEEVARALAEAEKYVQEDDIRRKRAEADNSADIEIYRANKLLRDHREELERVEISKLEYLIDATEESRTNGKVADIIKATAELAAFTMEVRSRINRR